MPVTITPAQLKRPNGELLADWFVVPASLALEYLDSTEYLDAILAAAIAEATANVDGSLGPLVAETIWDAAVEHFAYFRAYSIAYRDAIAKPASVKLGELSKAFNAKQIEGWKTLAEEHLAQYELVVQPLLNPAGPTRFILGQRSTQVYPEYSPPRSLWPDQTL